MLEAQKIERLNVFSVYQTMNHKLSKETKIMQNNIFIPNKNETLSDPLEEQFLDFQQRLEMVSDFYQKVAINIAFDQIKKEVDPQQDSEPMRSINRRPILESLYRVARWILNHAFPASKPIEKKVTLFTDNSMILDIPFDDL